MKDTIIRVVVLVIVSFAVWAFKDWRQNSKFKTERDEQLTRYVTNLSAALPQKKGNTM